MKRLGKLTGRIYEENEIHDMEECGTIITDEQENDKDWIEKQHKCDLVMCDKCRGCSLYR